jgi:hypothetical protein
VTVLIVARESSQSIYDHLLSFSPVVCTYQEVMLAHQLSATLPYAAIWIVSASSHIDACVVTFTSHPPTLKLKA